MTEYIMQIASKYGETDWGKRKLKSDKDQLNKHYYYDELLPDVIINNAISLIEADKKLEKYYKLIKQELKSRTTYKVLAIGVGKHNKNEIYLLDENGNNAKEFAHIDKEPFDGARRMNRLFVFDTKPKEITFRNTNGKVNDEKTFKEDQIKFENNCATIIIDFDK